MLRSAVLTRAVSTAGPLFNALAAAASPGFHPLKQCLDLDLAQLRVAPFLEEVGRPFEDDHVLALGLDPGEVAQHLFGALAVHGAETISDHLEDRVDGAARLCLSNWQRVHALLLDVFLVDS